MAADTHSPSRFGLLVRQYARFLLVGGGATLTHVVIFAVLMEGVMPVPLVANGLAFMVAVLVSFFGHFAWTYREHTRHLELRSARVELARFMVTALLGLVLNSLIVWLVTGLLELSYLHALVPMATLVPVLVFLVGRYWVFPSQQADAEAGN